MSESASARSISSSPPQWRGDPASMAFLLDVDVADFDGIIAVRLKGAQPGYAHRQAATNRQLSRIGSILQRSAWVGWWRREYWMSSSKGRLRDRRALITGAARGIGRETARFFVAEGAAVALLDRDEAGIRELSAETGGLPIRCDVAVPSSVEEAVSEALRAFDGLDAIVNAAGVLIRKPFEEIDLETWQQLFEINLRGPALICKAALPALRAAGSATIVNIASYSALRPSPGTTAYAASKGGLLMLGKCLAEELAPTIRVNTICPGIIDTAMTAGFMADPAVRRQVEQTNVMHRSGAPADIAAAAVFLTSGESAFMTGSQIVIDGGSVFY